MARFQPETSVEIFFRREGARVLRKSLLESLLPSFRGPMEPSTCSTLHVPAPSDASTRDSCEPSEGKRAPLLPFHGTIHSIRAERPALVCPPPLTAAGLKAARLHRRGQHGALSPARIGYNAAQQPAARMRARAIRAPCRVVPSRISWSQCLREARRL